MKDIILIDLPNHNVMRPSLSIATLYAYLKQKGVDVGAVDANALLYHSWSGGKYDVSFMYKWDHMYMKSGGSGYIVSLCEPSRYIGISLQYPKQISPAMELSKYLRRHLPSTKLILGGPFMLDPEYDQKRFQEHFDFICIGEGEQWLEHLIEHGVPPAMEQICDIETLPTPDYSWINKNLYARTRQKFSLYYQATRGCAYGKCAFCCRSNVVLSTYRHKSKEVMERDFLELKRQHLELQRLFFVDEFLPIPVLWDLCNIFQENSALRGIEWGCWLRVNPNFTPMFVQRMYDSGFRWTRFGVESLNQKTVNSLNKGIKVQDSWNICKMFKEAGITVSVLGMYGVPGQTNEELIQDKEDFERLRQFCDGMYVARFVLIKNTRIYNEMEKYGLKKEEVDAVMELNEARWCCIENGKPVPLGRNSLPVSYQMSPTWNLNEYEGEIK